MWPLVMAGALACGGTAHAAPTAPATPPPSAEFDQGATAPAVDPLPAPGEPAPDTAVSPADPSDSGLSEPPGAQDDSSVAPPVSTPHESDPSANQRGAQDSAVEASTTPVLPPVGPQEGGSWPAFGSLQLHGFASQGAIKSTKNNYLVNSKRGSVEFTEVGLAFANALTDRLRWGLQLFARQLGHEGDYRARVDWFYLDYRFADWLGLRAGRTKMPFGLYNEVNDVDSARVPILLPQAVYPILNRSFLLAMTGFELYGYLRLGSGGGFDYRLYGGTLYIDPPAPPAGLTLVDFQVPYVVGGRLLWEPPIDGLRLGGNVQWLRLNTSLAIPGMAGAPPTPLEYDLPFFLWLASFEYSAHDVLLASEYGRWRADIEITGTPTTRVVNQRYYVLAAYRMAPWFMPGAYFSSLTTNVDRPNTRDNYQRDWALTLRFDINRFWLVKLEGHVINGTTDLSTSLNGGVPLAMLPPTWLLFLAKTTVYF